MLIDRRVAICLVFIEIRRAHAFTRCIQTAARCRHGKLRTRQRGTVHAAQVDELNRMGRAVMSIDLLVCRMKSGDSLRSTDGVQDLGQGHFQFIGLADVAEVSSVVDVYELWGNMIALHFLMSQEVKLCQYLDDAFYVGLIRLDGKRPALVMLNVHDSQAKGRQDTRCCRHNGSRDRQHSSQAATVHWPGPAERHEGKLPWVIAPPY